MKKTTLLAIIQQSEYEYKYIAEWLQRSERKQDIKIDKFSTKLKILSILLTLFSPLPLLLSIRLALTVLSPIDSIFKKVVILTAIIKLYILKIFGLKIVAISGSYGKTSVKHIMDHLLSDQIALKKTPKSINTPVGISFFILQHLNMGDRLFIAELGEYYRGDIKNLANLIKPNFGVITEIGRQHLERMGDVKTIAKTILELCDYFKNKDDLIISDINSEFIQKNISTYGLKETSNYVAHNIIVDRRGTEFDLRIDKKNRFHKIFIPLYGEHQATNLLPSFWLANKLNMNLDRLATKSFNIPQIDRRLQPFFLPNNVLLLDNSYNTNPDSFNASLKLAKELSISRLILITMGFVELGDASPKIHYDLGKKISKDVDYLYLIDSPNMEYIKLGFIENGGNKNQVFVTPNLSSALQKAAEFYIPSAVVLIEGGYREIYT